MAFRCVLVDPSLDDAARAAAGLSSDPLVARAVSPRNPLKLIGLGGRRRRALRVLERPYEVVSHLIAMQADAVRFRDLAAAQPGAEHVAAETARSLARLLWLTADRIDEIAAIRAELGAAGPAEAGSAKAAWIEERRAREAALLASIERARADVAALAAQAEETAYAARLALQREATLDLTLPQPTDLLAAGDLDAANLALEGLAAAWRDLDQRLRSLGP